jgi:hypothetical protein
MLVGGAMFLSYISVLQVKQYKDCLPSKAVNANSSQLIVNHRLYCKAYNVNVYIQKFRGYFVLFRTSQLWLVIVQVNPRSAFWCFEYNEVITQHFWDWSKHGRTIYMALADATPSSMEYTKKISERSGFSNLFTEKLPEAIFYLMKTINKI